MSLSILQRLELIENALAQQQGYDFHYLGLCVNCACGSNQDHPHWDDEHIALAEAMERRAKR